MVATETRILKRQEGDGACKHGISAEQCSMCRLEWIREEQGKVDAELERMGVSTKTRRRGDTGEGRHGDAETRRHGDTEKGLSINNQQSTINNPREEEIQAMEKKNCLECGKEFEPRTKRGRFCSKKCMWNHNRPPKKAKTVFVPLPVVRNVEGNGLVKARVAKLTVPETARNKIQVFFAKVEGSDSAVKLALDAISSAIAGRE
jgi:hypothetical protein